MKRNTIIKERFKSLTSMLQEFKKRPLNATFEGQKLASERVESDRHFSHTLDFKEAEEVMKIGYKEPLEEMKNAILKIGQSDIVKRPRMYNDFVGFVPHVPNMLNNVPQTMINKQRAPRQNKAIHLIYGFGIVASADKKKIIEGGINFISLVNSLEKQGYRVKIDISFTTVTDKTAAAISVTVKDYQQNLNLLKLAFPLVHPSMLRRVCFKWLETVPNLKDNDYRRGYGAPLIARLGQNHEEERAFLKENKIISGENSFYCNVYQAFESFGPSDLAEKMGLVK